MAQKTDIELKTQTDAGIKVNGNREITPPIHNSIVTNMIDSKVNNGAGNVLTALLGHTTELTPTDNKHLSPKKYVDDQDATNLAIALAYTDSEITANAYDDTPVEYLDGSRAWTGNKDAGGNYITKLTALLDNAATPKIALSIANRILYDSAGNAIINFSSKSNGLGVVTGSWSAYLKSDSLTTNRNISFQDKDITVAGLDDIPSYGTSSGTVLEGSNDALYAKLAGTSPFTTKQTFTGFTTEMLSVSLLDTTYKTALEVSAANTLRIGNGFTGITVPITTTFSVSGLTPAIFEGTGGATVSVRVINLNTSATTNFAEHSFFVKNAAGTTTSAGSTSCRLTTTTAGSEVAEFLVKTRGGGAFATRFSIDNAAGTFTVPVGVPSYTVATLPTAATASRIIYVSDESGGAVLSFSDGGNWRRVTDRAIVS